MVQATADQRMRFTADAIVHRHERLPARSFFGKRRERPCSAWCDGPTSKLTESSDAKRVTSLPIPDENVSVPKRYPARVE